MEDADREVSRCKNEKMPLLQKIIMKEYDADISTDLPQVSALKYLGTTIGESVGVAKKLQRG